MFDLPSIKQLCTIENIPHHWLTTDILQIHHFQYHFFQNLTLFTHTTEQIRIYFLLRKIFRLNYQLVCYSKFQDACINFPFQFPQDELQPCLATSDKRHPPFYNLLTFLLLNLSTSPLIFIVVRKVLNFLILLGLMQSLLLNLFLLTLSPMFR